MDNVEQGKINGEKVEDGMDPSLTMKFMNTINLSTIRVQAQQKNKSN